MQFKVNAITGMQFSGILNFPPIDGVEQKLFEKIGKNVEKSTFHVPSPTDAIQSQCDHWNAIYRRFAFSAR